MLAARAVIFDLFHTLVDPPPPTAMEHVLETMPGPTLSPESCRWARRGFWPALLVPDHPNRVRELVLTNRACNVTHMTQLLARELGQKIPDARVEQARRLKDHMVHGCALTPGAAEVLDKAAASGVRLGLISNTDGVSAQVIWRLGLDRWFPSPVLSCEAGCRKPSPAIFRLALQQVCVSPERATMVGDSWTSDVVGALRFGMNVVWLDHGQDIVARILVEEGPASIAVEGTGGKLRFTHNLGPDLLDYLPVDSEHATIQCNWREVAAKLIATDLLSRVRRAFFLLEVPSLLF